jgi:hypothetical protein
MKSILRLFLVGLVALAARADMLRLRDGRIFTGQFLGATKTEIWFQQSSPGDIMAAQSYPIAQVESLTFGPDIRQSSAEAACKPAFGLDWLGGRGSNPDRQIQSLQSYH